MPDVLPLNLNTLPAGSHASSSLLHSERRSELAAGAGGATVTVHIVLLFYATCLSITSALAFAFTSSRVRALFQEGFVVYNSDRQWAVILGIMAAFTMGAGFLADVGTGPPPKKGDALYVKWMVGVHVGMLLPVVWSLWIVGLLLTLDRVSSANRVIACSAIVLSVLALTLIVLLRPSKKSSEKAAATGLV